MDFQLTLQEPEDWGATFSPCGLYRPHLWRVWEPSLPRLAFLMLNPSTADENADDPTVRRCNKWARAWGYGRLDVINLFDVRATDPQVMLRSEAPCSPGNDAVILEVSSAADCLVCAWGNHGRHHGRGESIRRRLRAHGITPHALALNRETGEPAHPLYLRSSVTPSICLI